jgi:hypothetical protein
MREDERLAVTSARRAALVEEMDTAAPTTIEASNDLVRRLDAMQERFRACLSAASDAHQSVDEALDSLEVVASSAVADAARALSRQVAELWIARDDFARAPAGALESVEAWNELERARANVEAAWDALRDAIRRELRLDE